MKIDGSKIIKVFIALSTILVCQSNTIKSQEFKIEGHFLVGEVLVALGDGVEAPFTLHVQQHKANPQEKRHWCA